MDALSLSLYSACTWKKPSEGNVSGYGVGGED